VRCNICGSVSTTYDDTGLMTRIVRSNRQRNSAPANTPPITLPIKSCRIPLPGTGFQRQATGRSHEGSCADPSLIYRKLFDCRKGRVIPHKQTKSRWWCRLGPLVVREGVAVSTGVCRPIPRSCPVGDFAEFEIILFLNMKSPPKQPL